jgi:hypothetical protein
MRQPFCAEIRCPVTGNAENVMSRLRAVANAQAGSFEASPDSIPFCYGSTPVLDPIRANETDKSGGTWQAGT